MLRGVRNVGHIAASAEIQVHYANAVVNLEDQFHAEKIIEADLERVTADRDTVVTQVSKIVAAESKAQRVAPCWVTNNVAHAA
jgi:uncharacterized protein HemY